MEYLYNWKNRRERKFDMAIEALKMSEGTDTISRRAAIDALKAIKYGLWEIDIPSPGNSPEYKEHHNQIQEMMGVVDNWIIKLSDLPSAQPDYDLDGYSSRLWKAAYERGKAEAERMPDDYYYDQTWEGEDERDLKGAGVNGPTP